MSQSIEDGLVERLQKREHYFRNAVEGEYDANLLMKAQFAIGAQSDTITRLKEALEPFAADWDAAQAYKDFLGADRREIYLANCVDLAAFERARTTLSALGGTRDHA